MFIFFFRNKLSKLGIRTKNKRQELAPIISNFLFHSPEDPKAEQKEYVELKIEIREYLNDKRFRKIISQILFDLQKDVAGGTRKRLFKLYKELELHHDAYRKLESWRWETVAQGILELSQMEVDESYQLIRKFVNDRRGVIRKQAELATVGLRPDGIDYLLDTTKHSISEWQQLKLIETLGKRSNYRPPQFKAWLLSQNKDVVLFALRLIKHYNQKGAEPSINELVKHKNDEVRIAAIQCIVDFHFESALTILKRVFWKSSNTVKINILNAIATLGSGRDIPFLKEVEEKETSFIIIGKTQNTINTIAPETILPSKDIIALREERGEETNTVFEESTTYPDSIEIEGMEFFDEIEIPKAKKDEQVEEHAMPTFELSPIEDEYGPSMDHLLGLVSSEDTNLDPGDLLETYDNISDSEKSELVGMLGDTADERELPLLEHIAENEMDSELRFHAFKTIQSIKKESKEPNTSSPQKETELPLEQQSIFYSLFHYTNEVDAKLILLKELVTVGDKKEIPFLESLLSEKEKSVVKSAKEAITILREEEDSKPSQDLHDTIAAERKYDLQREVKIVQEVHPEEDERIPMELFLLYEELGIESSNQLEKESWPFDFELSHEFFLETVTNKKEGNE